MFFQCSQHSFIPILSSVSIILSLLCKWKGKTEMDVTEVGCEDGDCFDLLVRDWLFGSSLHINL